MTISLKPVDRENFASCIKLEVAPDQKDFVASNVVSIAQSKVYDHMVPLVVYDDDEPVGFVMYSRAKTGMYWIVRLMIDAARQGRGFGRAATLALIDLMKRQDGCDEISLCFVPENNVAEKLYSSLGFKRTGAVEEGEIVMKLSLANTQIPNPESEIPN